MNVVFLDVDGVLNCTTSKSYCYDDVMGAIKGIDSDKVRRLAKIVKETDSTIILSSDWKYGWEKHYISSKPTHAKYLDNHLKKKGDLVIADKTPNINNGLGRGGEILSYLRLHQDVANYVILDDTFFPDFSDERIERHLVLTNYNVGLTDADMDRAIQILGGYK